MDPHVKPLIPVILVTRRVNGRCRLRASHSEIKDADDAESRMALACTYRPFGALTMTRQVMRRELVFIPEAASDGTVDSVLLSVPVVSVCNKV